MSTPNISISTELMKNYKQTELMSPEKKFEALQTDKGYSLLFSIGTDNVFYLTEETVGHDTGWTKTDLSTAQIARSFPGQSGLTCKTFEAAQSVVDGTIGVAMVITDSAGNDHLFLCLGNSNSDTGWTQETRRGQYPFDNPTKNVTIVGVFLSETGGKKQYIVVDILRDPASPEKLISRYYIDTTKTPVWQLHDVSNDLEADSYTSCLGRQYLPNSRHQPTIDGLYTSGQVRGAAQFTFQPLYNVFDTTRTQPAKSAKLQLPGGIIANSIASCRKSDMSTDLYACGSDGGLYYFASGNQIDGATAVLLVKNTMYNGVRKMYAHQSDTAVIVWGLNGSDEIFYTTCPVGQQTASPSAWSYPLPIVTGVDLFSPYLNRVDDANTFFAVAESTLQKLVKSPKDSVWTSQSITLPSPNSADTQKYSSYTTRIQATDANNQPLVNTPVSISAETRTPVYINHLYYILDSAGIKINTDEMGSVTVVEWVNNLTGTKLNVSAVGGAVQQINPMDKPFKKIAQLNTADSLKNAVITNDDGSTKQLVSSSISPRELQSVANSNVQLGNVYNTLTPSGNGSVSRNSMPSLGVAGAPALNIGGIDALWVDIADLFLWLESGVEAFIQIVKDAATDVWHFVATIAGKVYAAVLDAVETVVAAAEWVFDQIKTGIEDLVKYLEFLFGWQDILITHNVMKNFFTQLVHKCANDLSGYKTDIAAAFQSLQNDINKWADIPNFDQTPSSTTTQNQAPEGQHSAPANLGVHHFQGNAGNANSSFTPATLREEIFQDLLNLLEKEGDTLSGAYNAIKTDIVDQFQTLTVTQIIQKFIAILADTLLQTAENIILTAIDVFVQIIEGVLDVLTASIDIPVISWLYKELTGNDLSALDVICLIGAIPATIVYKIATNAAPFPQGDPFTEGLLNATSFGQIQGLFFTSPSQPSHLNVARPVMMAAVENDPEPVLNESRLKVFGFMSGMFAALGTFVLIVCTAKQRALEAAEALEEAPLLPPAGGLNKMRLFAIFNAIGNVAYVFPNVPMLINANSANWYQNLNSGLTVVSIVKGFINIGLTNLDSTGVASKISPAIESIINIAWNVPVIMNIKDNKDRWNTDYIALIPESIGNFAFNIGGMMEFPIALIKDPESKFTASVVQYVFMGIYGVCMPGSPGEYTRSARISMVGNFICPMATVLRKTLN